MKVKVEDVSPVQKKLQVEVPADLVRQEFDRTCKKIGQSVKIKGFRKGKAPKSLVKRYYEAEIREEVLEGLIRETFPKALEELDVKLISEPRLGDAGELKEGETFSYSAILDLWPEFDLPDYKAIRLERPRLEVTEAEVDEQMESLRKHFGSLEDVEEDRGVIEGDIVILDFKGFHEGEPVEGLDEENYYLEVGSGHFNEQFEKALIGTPKGAEKEIEVKYEDDALNDRVAGKTIVYKVHVKGIKKRILPELDNEFAKKFGPQYETIEDLRARMRKQIESDKKEAQERALREQLIDKLLDGLDFPIPESLIQKKLVQMVDNVVAHLEERGLDLESTGMSEERLKKKMRPDAEKQVKMEIVLDKIADKESITVSNEELMRYMDVSKQYKNIDPNQLMSAVQEYVLPKLRAKNTIDFLMEHAEIVDEAPGTTDENSGKEA